MASLETLIQLDCELFDFLRTVTLEPDDRTSWSQSVTYATKTQLNKKEAAQLGPVVLENETTKFGLAVAHLNDRVPEQGYYITDPLGVVWQIVSADLATLGTRYLCYCVKTHLAASATASNQVLDPSIDLATIDPSTDAPDIDPSVPE